LALELALSSSNEFSFLGRFKTTKSKVGYIDEENGVETLKERLSMLDNGRRLPIKDIAFLSFQGFNLMLSESRDQLQEFIKKNGINVVIVDTLRRIIKGDENDAAVFNDIFVRYLRPIIEETGCTFILQHHLRKGIGQKKSGDILDELRGSSEIANYADSVLICERNTKIGGQFTLYHAKSRRSKQQEPLILSFEVSEGQASIKLIGTANEIMAADEKCAHEIRKHIIQNSITQFKTKDILDSFSGNYSDSTIKRALRLLVEQKHLANTKKGFYELNQETKESMDNMGQTSLAI
ncbi:MAG: hypothetical protein EPN88_02125, partial [Bacteroidetes bacterium]